MDCPVCGAVARVSCSTKRFSDHVRRYRRCTGCKYTFVTAQSDGREQITDHLPCGYAGHLAKSQRT